MDLLDKNGHRIRLIRLDREACGSLANRCLGASVIRQGPPPTIFREAASGLIRVTYRELVIRFQPRLPRKLRQALLRKHSLKILRTNAFGVGALVLSVNPALSRKELKGLLEATADKIGGGFDAKGRGDELGCGRIDAGKAVRKAAKLA
jgi:hypothetical protein